MANTTSVSPTVAGAARPGPTQVGGTLLPQTEMRAGLWVRLRAHRRFGIVGKVGTPNQMYSINQRPLADREGLEPVCLRWKLSLRKAARMPNPEANFISPDPACVQPPRHAPGGGVQRSRESVLGAYCYSAELPDSGMEGGVTGPSWPTRLVEYITCSGRRSPSVAEATLASLQRGHSD